MHSKAKRPTKAERKRMQDIVESGCCACRSDDGLSLWPVEVHHLLDGGTRRGHRFTVALCYFHHRGIPPQGMKAKEATAKFGPSLALDGRAFRLRYGKDDALLAFQDFLISLDPVTPDERTVRR